MFCLVESASLTGVARRLVLKGSGSCCPIKKLCNFLIVPEDILGGAQASENFGSSLNNSSYNNNSTG